MGNATTDEQRIQDFEAEFEAAANFFKMLAKRLPAERREALQKILEGEEPMKNGVRK